MSTTHHPTLAKALDLVVDDTTDQATADDNGSGEVA